MAKKKISTGGFKRYMTYDDKRYELSSIRYDRKAAEIIAESLRSKGYNARIEDYMHAGIKFGVYKRKVR